MVGQPKHAVNSSETETASNRWPEISIGYQILIWVWTCLSKDMPVTQCVPLPGLRVLGPYLQPSSAAATFVLPSQALRVGSLLLVF